MELHDLETTGKHFNVTTEEAGTRLNKCLEILRQVRSKRPRPHLDNKIVTAWNGPLTFLRRHLIHIHS
jgi:uncharacterized protein YyaL (SSP411 family)